MPSPKLLVFASRSAADLRAEQEFVAEQHPRLSQRKATFSSHNELHGGSLLRLCARCCCRHTGTRVDPFPIDVEGLDGSWKGNPQGFC